MPDQEIIIAISGASGAAYGLKLIQRLSRPGIHQHILISDAGRIVLKHECEVVLPENPGETKTLLVQHLNIDASGLSCYAANDWFSPAASGSSGIRKMVIVPCSMGCMARIAAGTSDHLIERAADVQLKESGQLILVQRETPLSTTHLENMLVLSRQGVVIMPAMPAYYQKPVCIEDMVEFMVERILNHLQLSTGGFQWGR